MRILDKDDANQMYGRMMECCDIERAIESGEFKSLNDVLEAIKSRGAWVNKTLRDAGFFKGIFKN